MIDWGMTKQNMGAHRRMRVQDVLNEYLNKPYEDGIYVRLEPGYFGTNPQDARAELQEAFEGLPGDEATVQSSKATITFKLLANGYVVERRSNIEKRAIRDWNYAIRSAKDFLKSTVGEIDDDHRRCERQIESSAERPLGPTTPSRCSHGLRRRSRRCVLSIVS
jgi:hypothetical protein